MNTSAGLNEIIGLCFAIIFVIYWAYAGRIILQKERNWLIKIPLFALLFLYPVYAPFVIYLIYYRHVLPVLKQMFVKRDRQVV